MTEPFSEEFTANAIKSFRELWIIPEILRRKATHNWPKNVGPDNFTFSRCLIKLPRDAPPIVEFDHEVKLVASYDVAPGAEVEPGQPVFLHQLRRITKVQRPEHNGIPVAFVLFWQLASGGRVVFDFSPNNSATDIDLEFSLGESIARTLNDSMFHTTVALAESINPKLNAAGLWSAPALIPYPLSLISKQIEEGLQSQAMATLRDHCTGDFLMALVSEWPGKEAFRTRQRLFDNALKAHCRQEFDLSIHALLPQVEGVMSDWLWQNYADRDIPWRMESKTKKLHQILLEIIAAEPEASQEKIIASTFEFVINVVLKNFKWTTGDAPVELTFPGRHPVGHGRYLDQLYSEENSIKLFLLLDTIRRLI